MERLIAFGTDDEQHLKAGDHVGMSRYFVLYKISATGHEFVERRENREQPIA